MNRETVDVPRGYIPAHADGPRVIYEADDMHPELGSLSGRYLPAGKSDQLNEDEYRNLRLGREF